MKKLRFIPRFAAVAMAFAAVAGFTSCNDDDSDKKAEVPVVVLDTPQNPVAKARTAEELTFAWDAVSGAYSYTAQLRYNQAGAVIKETIVNGALTEVTFGELQDGTEYYFQVRANDQYSQGKDSFFSEMIPQSTLVADPTYTALSKPQNLLCDDSQTTPTSLTFRWDVVDNAASYTYKITPAGGESRNGIVEGALSVTVQGLNESTAYSFQVRANPAENSTTHRSGSYCDAVEASTMGKLSAPEVAADETASTVSSLKFTWAAVPNAGSYVYAVSADGGNTYGAESTTDLLYALVGDLTDGTEYFFRVKAVPVGGSVTHTESSWATAKAATVSAAATPLGIPAPAEVAASTTSGSFTVEWAPVTDAASYDVEVEGDAGSPYSVTTASYTATGLTASTTYRVRVKAVAATGQTSLLDSDWSAWVSVTTSVASGAIDVTTVQEFKDALGSIADGGTITVKPGTYNFSAYSDADSKYVLNTIAITKNISIIGEAGAGGALPLINAKTIQLAANLSQFVIKNVEYSAFDPDASGNMGTTATASGYFVDVASTYTVNSIVIENCYVHHLTSGVLRVNRNKGGTAICNAKDITMKNNRLYNIYGKDGCIINGRETAAVEGSTWVIQNNTVTGIGVYSAASPTKQRLFGLPHNGTTSSITISNNTFFDIFSTDNCIDATNGSADNGAIVVEKNIFTSYTASGMRAPRLGTNAGCSVKDNVLNQTWSFTNSSPLVTGDTTNTYNTDPEFQATYQGGNVPADADFTPSAAVKALGVGDSRWLQ